MEKVAKKRRVVRFLDMQRYDGSEYLSAVHQLLASNGSECTKAISRSQSHAILWLKFVRDKNCYLGHHWFFIKK